MKSFIEIDDHLACGSQPNAEDLQALALQGTEVVVNLGLSGTAYALTDEAQIVAANGMVYYHLPVDFEHPDAKQLHQFSALLKQHPGQKIFVHCAANKRASVFTALHGQRHWGWDARRADHLIQQCWQPTPAWQALIDEQRRTL